MRDLFLANAKKYIGVHEIGGDNMGPEVVKFQKAVDGVARGEPWCMAFVQYCLNETDPDKKSGIHSSEHCLSVWNKTHPLYKRQTPLLGYIVIWQHFGTDKGHTGIVSEVIDSYWMITIEGNTGPESTVNRNGGGVYMKKRRIQGPTGDMKIVGYLVPWFNGSSLSSPSSLIPKA